MTDAVVPERIRRHFQAMSANQDPVRLEEVVMTSKETISSRVIDGGGLPGVEVRRFASGHIDQEYELHLAVAAPDGFDDALPVLLVPDANIVFAATVQLIGGLQMAGLVPPIALVGLGYPFDQPVLTSPERTGQWIRHRARDYLSATVNDRVIPHLLVDEWGGGADRFLDVIEGEVLPIVAEWREIDHTDIGIVGQSGGGHLALYAGLTRPGTYRRVLASSPFMVNYDGLESLVGEWATTPGSERQVLFLGAGERETETLVANVYRMAGALRAAAPDGATIATCTLADEIHTTAWAPLYTRGLAVLYGTKATIGDHYVSKAGA